MRKVLSFLAIAAMLCCVACKKTPTNNGNNNNNNNNNQEQKEDPPVVEKPSITIDGDFADWAKLDQSKVAVANCNAEGKYAGLKVMKVYANENYIWVYFKCDPDAIKEGWVTIDMVLNADNSADTGGYGEFWTDMDAEWLLEGPIASDGVATSYDCALFKWWGAVGEDGWNWTNPDEEATADNGWGAIFPEGSGLASSEGNMTSGEFEIQIIREMLAGVDFADSFTVGAFLSASWTSVGALPNDAITDENPNGKTPKLKVTVDK